MDCVNQYLENLPNLYYALICTIPTITYFASVKFYLRYHQDDKLPDKKYITDSSKNMVGTTFGNYFLVYLAFNIFSNVSSFSFLMIFMGCLLIDTLEYWYHYLFHYNKYLYNKYHVNHHTPFPVHPKISFANDDFEAVGTSLVIVLTTIYLQFSFIEYIIISSLSFAATVCDHTYTSKNKFHYLHHCGDKKTNFQQPFFTFWDHINSTYNKKTITKIPFVP